jgi:multidrug efflux system membrane fusion protein
MKVNILAILALLAAGCGDAKHEAKRAEPAAPVAVNAVEVAAQQWPAVYETTGTVRARTSAVIAARMMGYVREVRVREGDHVRLGQILVTLDARDLDVNSGHAAAALDEVRSRIPEAESAERAASANFELAQSTFNRMQDLFNKKSISNQELDEASARLKATQATQEMARARRAQVDSQAARAQQDIRAAEVARSYAEITAPFAGVVTAKTADAGAMAVPGAPLLTLESDGGYWLEAAVEESRLKAIRVGQPVSVTLGGVDGAIAARVSEVVPAIDAASRSYTVKIDLPVLAMLRSGLFGRASFSLGSRSPLAIPARAVKENGQLQSVLVAERGVARMRLITVGEKSKDQIEVLSGLAAGEKVIFPVPLNLGDGALVEVRP